MNNTFKEKTVLVTLFLFLFITKIQAQEFVNGDLNGTINGFSSLPIGWLAVPFSDVNCEATSIGTDTPDLTSFSEPNITIGVIGNPYSGNTFVSGEYTRSIILSDFYQEGIHQIVSGFIPGNTYPINFHQSVVKKNSCLDSSGSWAVYVDTNLIGISAPTFSAEPFNSTNFIWEFRTFNFIATAISHDIKFLPLDDDPNPNAMNNNFITYSGVRMGIDCIYITEPCVAVGNNAIRNRQEQVLFYPNPVIDKFHFNNSMKIFSEVILYDLASRIILQENVTESTSIDLTNFDSGIYIYELRNKNEVLAKGKVIKQ